jgi:hypothetical protein
MKDTLYNIMKDNEGSFSCFSINDCLEEISVSNVPLAPFFSKIVARHHPFFWMVPGNLI